MSSLTSNVNYIWRKTVSKVGQIKISITADSFHKNTICLTKDHKVYVVSVPDKP